MIVSAAEDSQRPVQRIGVYRIEEEIGSGAMGKVYRATHETLGKAVALKIVHADDPSGEVSARFLQEGIAASRVRHPNVVEILDAGTHQGTAYLAMQLLEGESLAECLSRQGRLPQTYAIDLILPVCAALVAAHEAGVLHRDLKPANIFLADVGRGDPEPILVDFGISKILGPVDAELTQNPRFLGSPLYIAPEQADGAAGSPRSDQYSLALTLYEALLGVRPFAKYTSSLIQLLRHVAEGDIRRPCELDASIPDELDQALCRAISTDPRQRFASVRELGAALLPFASQARRTLWQQSFVDTERTMTSANAPVSNSQRSSRRVQVSVETPLADRPASETIVEPPNTLSQSPDDFLSHSSLFGEDNDPASDGEQSSISRRDLYSRGQSERLSSPWSEEEQGTHPSLQPRPTIPEAKPQADAPRGSFTRSVAALGLGLFGLALLTWVALATLVPEPPQTPKKFSVSLTVTPPQALIEIDGKAVGTGRFSGAFARDGSVHRMRISFKGHEPQTIVFRDQAPPDDVTLAPLPPPSAVHSRAHGRESEKPSAFHQEEQLAASAAPALAKTTGVIPPPSASRAVEAPLPSGSETTAQAEHSSSDPQPKEVSTGPDTKEPAKAAKPGKPSIQTGNLDPWAQ